MFKKGDVVVCVSSNEHSALTKGCVYVVEKVCGNTFLTLEGYKLAFASTRFRLTSMENV